MQKRILSLALFALIALSACTLPETHQDQTAAPANRGTIIIQFEVQKADGSQLLQQTWELESGKQTLWQAMQEKVPGIEFQDTAYGVYIKGLVGVKAGTTEYWSLVIDGMYSDRGASDITLDKDMHIVWKLQSLGDHVKIGE